MDYKFPDNENKRSSIEVKTTASASINDVISELQANLGSSFTIEPGEATHKSLYRAIKIEKFIAFMVLVIILLLLIKPFINHKKNVEVVNGLSEQPQKAKLIDRNIFVRVNQQRITKNKLEEVLKNANIPPEQISEYIGLAGLGELQIEAAVRLSLKEEEKMEVL